jgi:hypothetical protein
VARKAATVVMEVSAVRDLRVEWVGTVVLAEMQVFSATAVTVGPRVPAVPAASWAVCPQVPEG